MANFEKDKDEKGNPLAGFAFQFALIEGTLDAMREEAKKLGDDLPANI